MEMVQNPSQSLFYDALAMATSETGLIDRDHYKCPAVTKQVTEYHMEALLNTSSSLSYVLRLLSWMRLYSSVLPPRNWKGF